MFWTRRCGARDGLQISHIRTYTQQSKVSVSFYRNSHAVRIDCADPGSLTGGRTTINVAGHMRPYSARTNRRQVILCTTHFETYPLVLCNRVSCSRYLQVST